ncbi:hypothetical protein AG1IA_06072 [Rhizoctonia solani AG-1 IA]|uniref:Uncharacterized protein n=1 Tax=Thanatephorus cucumeris (strain AG1-IA) TaxID=983506 RepID=L8WT32_THACA|nr:hypothetical protein AG1IA_06072 [Rhizoctonia solani AG-1 IA]
MCFLAPGPPICFTFSAHLIQWSPGRGPEELSSRGKPHSVQSNLNPGATHFWSSSFLQHSRTNQESRRRDHINITLEITSNGPCSPILNCINDRAEIHLFILITARDLSTPSQVAMAAGSVCATLFGLMDDQSALGCNTHMTNREWMAALKLGTWWVHGSTNYPWDPHFYLCSHYSCRAN